MKKLFDMIPDRLKSRKLWIAIISAIYFLVHGNTVEAMAVIMGYLGIQGYQDANTKG